MSGTEPDAGSDRDEGPERFDLVRPLTTAGWFAFAGWLFFLFRQIARATQVGAQPFATVWEQRIEVLSFFVLPPNALMLVPAAATTTLATWLAASEQRLDLAIQLRLVRWSAIVMIAIALVSIGSIFVNETGSPTENQDVAMRLSGLSVAGAIVVVTRAAERASPGWRPFSGGPDPLR